MLRAWLVVLIACRGGGAAIVLPPAQVATGIGTPLARATALRGPSDEITAGVHWASLAWKRTPIDIGVGYVGSFRAIAPDFAARTTTSSPAPAPELAANGGYVELGWALRDRRHVRSWISWRAERVWVDTPGAHFAAIGTGLRVSTELYGRAAFAHGGRGAAVAQVGAWAIGVYAEASARELPREYGPITATIGVAFRVPLFFAAVK